MPRLTAETVHLALGDWQIAPLVTFAAIIVFVAGWAVFAWSR